MWDFGYMKRSFKSCLHFIVANCNLNTSKSLVLACPFRMNNLAALSYQHFADVTLSANLFSSGSVTGIM